MSEHWSSKEISTDELNNDFLLNNNFIFNEKCPFKGIPLYKQVISKYELLYYPTLKTMYAYILNEDDSLSNGYDMPLYKKINTCYEFYKFLSCVKFLYE